jgi:hypothetical protein
LEELVACCHPSSRPSRSPASGCQVSCGATTWSSRGSGRWMAPERVRTLLDGPQHGWHRSVVYPAKGPARRSGSGPSTSRVAMVPGVPIGKADRRSFDQRDAVRIGVRWGLPDETRTWLASRSGWLAAMQRYIVSDMVNPGGRTSNEASMMSWRLQPSGTPVSLAGGTPARIEPATHPYHGSEARAPRQPVSAQLGRHWRAVVHRDHQLGSNPPTDGDRALR